MKKMVGEEKALVFFLDKKCFYTTGRQIRLKHLPRPPHKLKGIDLKLMFMVFVAQPLPEIGFDGRIFLKRIPEKKEWKKTSYNHSFPDYAIINAELTTKIGGWRGKVHGNTQFFSGIYQQLYGYYHLDNFVPNRLTFMYKSYGERGSDKKGIFLSGYGRI